MHAALMLLMPEALHGPKSSSITTLGVHVSIKQPQTSFWWTPHPVIVTIRDNRDYIRVLLYSYYTTITGWGVLLRHPWGKSFFGLPGMTLEAQLPRYWVPVLKTLYEL